MLTHPGLARIVGELSRGQARVVNAGAFGKPWDVIVVVEAYAGGPISAGLERRLNAALQTHRTLGTTLRVQSVG